MRALLLHIVVLLLASAGVCEAQTPGIGYVVGGVGGYTNSYTTGNLEEIAGGGERLVTPRVGLGVELGLIGGLGLLTVSPNATYRFRNPAQVTVPFVRGGYTFFGGGEAAVFGAPSIGAGVTHWFRPNAGLIVEVRDVIHKAYDVEQFWTVRVGFAFR